MIPSVSNSTQSAEKERPKQTESQSQNLKTIQELAAALEYQTAKADELRRQIEAWKEQAKNWQELFESERQRSGLLQNASGDRQAAEANLKKALEKLQSLYDAQTQKLEEANKKIAELRKSRSRWAIIGTVVGALIVLGR